MPTRTLVALALLAPLPAYAQIDAPTSVNAYVGRLGTVKATVDADECGYVVTGAAGPGVEAAEDTVFDAFRECEEGAVAGKRTLKIRVLGVRPGLGYVVIIGIKGGKLLTHVVTVHVKANPDPGPVPPPPPVPPGPTPPGPGPTPPPDPTDPLVAEVLAAWRADTGEAADKKKWLSAYAGLMTVMVGHLEQVETVGDLLADFKTAAKDLMPAGSLPGTQKVCVTRLFALTGDDAEKVLDRAVKDKLADALKRLSRALAIEGGR